MTSGRPFDVTNQRALEREPDGTVTLVVWRRTDDPGRQYEDHRFNAPTAAAAFAAYRDWCAANHDRITRRAERMSRWGPTGTGAMR